MTKKILLFICAVLIAALAGCNKDQVSSGGSGSADEQLEMSLRSIISETTAASGIMEAVYVNRNGYESNKKVEMPVFGELEILETPKDKGIYRIKAQYTNHSWQGEAVFSIPDFKEGQPVPPDSISLLEATAAPLYELDFSNPDIYPAFYSDYFNYKETPDSRTETTPVTEETIEKIELVEFVPDKVEYIESGGDRGVHEHYIVDLYLNNNMTLRGTVFFRYLDVASSEGVSKWGKAHSEYDFVKK